MAAHTPGMDNLAEVVHTPGMDYLAEMVHTPAIHFLAEVVHIPPVVDHTLVGVVLLHTAVVQAEFRTLLAEVAHTPGLKRTPGVDNPVEKEAHSLAVVDLYVASKTCKSLSKTCFYVCTAIQLSKIVTSRS